MIARVSPPAGEFGEAEAASILAWWIEAGVDVALADTPGDWRVAANVIAPSSARIADGAAEPSAAPAPTPRPVAATPAAPVPKAALAPPGEFAAYRDWWREADDLPLAATGAPRAPILGDAGAALMLLGDMAEPGADGQAEPFAGDSLALLEKMVAAIDLPLEAQLRAAIVPLPMASRQWPAGEVARLGDLARHLLRLARPQRLLLLGDGAARTLLGEAVTSARGRAHVVEGVRTVATFHPRHLLRRPVDKRLAWEDLLLLTSNEG